ncbi:hypothetical protein ACI2K4_09930 [Micromonospora sp. NPDC050397]|uniref:hypothetical protein n=1 Tax=Micromonospora sp. NPDC050397 TaxID=3364279 RepID=UPI00384E8765
MLRVGVLLVALLGLATGGPPAGPRTPAPAMVPAALGGASKVVLAGGTKVCTIGDNRLTEISGLAATDDGYVAVNDSADLESRRKVFFLDRRCRVTRTVSYPSRPRDTEDMAIARDGTIWVADIGDNDRVRETIGLWRLARGANSPVAHRFTYPDGAHDAEALLLAGDGTPIVVTKDPGTARLYAPAQPPRAGATVPLRRVGQFGLPSTGTGNPWGVLGRLVVTGGATSADGTRVVLRTYADAFEFDVTDGDVAKAVTEGEPRITPLPNEPQGESITYSRDGRSLLTVSETSDQPAGTLPTILGYTPTGGPTPNSPNSPTTRAAPERTSPVAGAAPTGGPSTAASAPEAQPGRLVGTARLIVGIGVVLLVVTTIAVIALLLAGRRTRRPPSRPT